MYPNRKQYNLGSISIGGDASQEILFELYHFWGHLFLLNLIDSCIAYEQYYIQYVVGATGTTTRCTGCKVNGVCHNANTKWTTDCVTYQCKQLGSFWMYADIVSARKYTILV